MNLNDSHKTKKMFFVFFHSSCCVERHEPLKYKIYCLKIKYCAKTSYPSILPIHLYYSFRIYIYKIFTFSQTSPLKIIFPCQKKGRELEKLLHVTKQRTLESSRVCFIFPGSMADYFAL
jgi:hypothetical protein